jgi:AP-1 complex subunit gamma-1
MFGYDEIRRGVLEKMPPPVIKEVSRVFERETAPKARAGKKTAKKQSDEEALLDLMGGEPPEPTAPLSGAPQSNMELLSGILGGDLMASNSSSPPPSAQSNLNSIMDLFNAPATSSPAPAAAPQQSAPSLLGGLGSTSAPSVAPTAAPVAAQVYNKNGLQITLQLARTADGIISIIARFKNNSFTDRITSVSLQAAVPRSMRLQLQTISDSELDPDAEATQMMRVAGNRGSPLKMRLKIGYVKDDVGDIMDMVDWAESS